MSLFVAGAALRGIWNDSRSAKCRSRIVNDVAAVLGEISSKFWRVFAQQAQYAVMLEDDTRCSAHCK